MISGNLFPSVSPSIGNTYEVSEYFPMLNIDGDFPDNYWLGWVAWENLSDIFHVSRYTLDPNDDYIHIDDVTVPDNSNVTYMTRIYSGSFYNNYPNTVMYKLNPYWTNAGLPYTSSSTNYNTNSFRFLNKCVPQNTRVPGIDVLILTVFRYGGSQSSLNNTGSYLTQIRFDDVAELLGFLSGEMTKTVTINVAGNSQSIEITGQDLKDGYEWAGTSGSNYFTAFTFIQYFSDMVHGSSYVETFEINPVVDVHYEHYDNEIGRVILAGTQCLAGSYINGRTILIPNNNAPEPYWTADYADSNAFLARNNNGVRTYYFPGGWHGSIPKFFIDGAQNGRWYKDGNILFLKANFINNSYLYRILDPDEIIKYIGLNARFAPASAGSDFVDGAYVPLVTENDEFTTKLQTGTFEELEPTLRPWQYNAISPEYSDYTEDDKPEYNPFVPPAPGEEPDEGDWGDVVGISQTRLGEPAFSSFEVVRLAGLKEFASELWEAPSDFWESLSVLGEINANLGDYLLSCRAYPVNLNVENVHKDIYIGAGGRILMAADVFSTRLTNWIQLGMITIPRQYGNFLDYNPYTSATISLPFAGTFEINPKYLYDSQIDLTLVVDVTDGSGMWIVENQTHRFPILIKQCRVAVEIPISGLNATQMASNILNATMTSGQHALTAINKIGGAAVQTGAAIATGGTIGAEGALSMTTMGAQVGLQALTDATNMAMGNKEIPFYTGGSGGAAAAEGNFEPYITLRRPLCTNPENFAHTVGNLVNRTATIGGLSGFTACRNVDVSGIGQAVDKEKAQIKRILESGFYA